MIGGIIKRRMYNHVICGPLAEGGIMLIHGNKIMNKEEIIRKFKDNRITKAGSILAYERGKEILGNDCTPREYEYRIRVLSDYLRI